jgi:hypothetical protein
MARAGRGARRGRRDALLRLFLSNTDTNRCANTLLTTPHSRTHTHVLGQMMRARGRGGQLREVAETPLLNPQPTNTLPRSGGAGLLEAQREAQPSSLQSATLACRPEGFDGVVGDVGGLDFLKEVG